jgi:oligosaccharide repeat unit polymerase
MLVQNGFSLELLFLDWVATSSSYATNRSLNDAYEYGIVGQLSTFFPIFVSAVGGVLSSSFCSFKKKCLYFFLSMFPAILFMISHSSKIIFLYSLFFYGAVFISFKIFKGHKISISKRIMKLAFTIGLLILPIILFSFTLREGSNEGLSFALLPTIFSYAYGSIFAFSDFFLFYVGIDSQSNYIVEGTFTLGYYSFKSVFDLFGGTKVFPPGYYFDFYNYNDYIQTNIFTLFRQLIQDFGVIGSLIFVFIVGTIVNVSYVFIFKINYPYFFICLLVLFFVFLGMSYMFSIFTSRSSVLVVVVLYSVLKLNSLMLNKPRDLKIFFKN